MKMSKNTKIAVVVTLIGIGLTFLYVRNKKKSGAIVDSNPVDSTTNSVEDSSSPLFATETPDLDTAQGPMFFNNRIGIYMPKPIPEMSAKNQEIDLTV